MDSPPGWQTILLWTNSTGRWSLSWSDSSLYLMKQPPESAYLGLGCHVEHLWFHNCGHFHVQAPWRPSKGKVCMLVCGIVLNLLSDMLTWSDSPLNHVVLHFWCRISGSVLYMSHVWWDTQDVWCMCHKFSCKILGIKQVTTRELW